MRIAIIGGDRSQVADIEQSFVDQCPHKVKRLCVADIVSVDARLAWLAAELPKGSSSGPVAVIVGVGSQAELLLLRQRGVMIYHCHGKLTDLYNTLVIDSADRFVGLPGDELPLHVYTPLHVVSECLLAKKQTAKRA